MPTASADHGQALAQHGEAEALHPGVHGVCQVLFCGGGFAFLVFGQEAPRERREGERRDAEIDRPRDDVGRVEQRERVARQPHGVADRGHVHEPAHEQPG